MGVCYYHGPTEEELRPYGPGGASICFPCMKESPEREKAAQETFGTLLEANAIIGDGIVTIGTENGPTPGIDLNE